MAKLLFILLISFYYNNAMEMRETVERMVMVRRTGSDLQPAATGFIYRSDNNGPASLIKLGESDVHKHLDNLPGPAHYEQPKAFAAPIPVAAGPFYSKEENEGKATQNSEYVIPVVEITDNKNQIYSNEGDKLDDASDYKKSFDDYIAKYYGAHNDDDHHYYENGDGNDFHESGQSAHGEKGEKGHKSSHEYGKGGAGDYHSEKYDSYSVSGGGEHKKHYDEADAHGADHAHGHAYEGGDHGHKSHHSKGEDTDGYHKLFNKDEFKKDHDFYDEKGHQGGFHKFADGHSQHGLDAGGFKKGGSHDSGHDAAGFGKHGFHDSGAVDVHHDAYSGEEGHESAHHGAGGFGAESGYSDGKGYGYEIKH